MATKVPKKSQVKKSNPKWKRIVASLANKRYEKQRVRTARNKASQAAARARKAAARAAREV